MGAIDGQPPSALAIEVMRELGIDLADRIPQLLPRDLSERADVIVTMGCGDECPFLRAGRREDWQIPDPKEMPPEQFRFVRDLIEEKVKDLVRQLR